jgi:hypothetical protein
VLPDQACAELQRAAQALLGALHRATALALRGAGGLAAAAEQLAAPPAAEHTTVSFASVNALL